MELIDAHSNEPCAKDVTPNDVEPLVETPHLLQLHVQLLFNYKPNLKLCI
jgi:hypothetical protein